MGSFVDGLECAEFGSGDGLPILMLHEGLGSLAMWRDFPEKLALATGRRVLAWSRQGYGGSRKFDEPYSVDFMHREADAAASLLAKFGLTRVHVFGHSDGASIALLLAARHLGLVASLVLEAPHVFVEPMCLDAIFALRASPNLDDLIARLGKYHTDSVAVVEQWTAIWLDPQFAVWTIADQLVSVTAPALLIQGDDDEYGTFAQLDQICERVPHAQQLRLANCGHSPHRDQEQVVLDATADFQAQTEHKTAIAGAYT